MKLGMSSASFYGRMETEDAARHLLQFPLDTCEIFLETPSEYSAIFGAFVRERLGLLHCTSVHPKGSQFEGDLFSSSLRQRMDALHLFEGVCASGEKIRARYYVFHGPFSVRRKMSPGQIQRLEPSVRDMQKCAADHGMEVLWENVSWCTGDTPAHIREIQVRLPDMHFVLDVKQAYQAGTTPQQMMQAMGSGLRHVHVLDWEENGKLLLPGKGQVDWTDLFRELHKIGFDGSVILEPYSSMSENEAEVKESLHVLRDAMNNAERER